MIFAPRLYDAHLVKRALCHDTMAFTALVNKHMPAVTSVAMAYTKNRADAEDAAQEAFLKAWLSLDTLQAPSHFGGWVITIARNVALTQFNRKRREAEHIEQYKADAAMTMNHTNMDQNDAMGELLSGLVSKLPDSDRELILLRYQGCKKTRDIAELLSLSHSTVRKRLERIRHVLGQALLASLEIEPAEKARREQRASQIASAVIAVTPPWKDTVVGTGSVLGVAGMMKPAIMSCTVLVLLVTGYLGIHREPTIPSDISSSIVAPVKSVEAVAESMPTANQVKAAAQVRPESPSPAIVKEGGSIAGRLYEEDTGNGVVDGVIRLYCPATQQEMESRTDESGHYCFEGLAAGKYSTTLKWDGDLARHYPRSQNITREQIVQLKENASVTDVNFAVLGGVTVRGRLVGLHGDALVGVIVNGWSEPRAVEAVTMTDGEGCFEFRGFVTDLPAFFWPHSTTGLAMPPTGPVRIPPEGIDNLLLSMQPESAISGCLVDQDGIPLPGVQVTTWPQNGSHFSKDFVTVTNDSGSFELRGLYASSYGFQILFPGDTSTRRLTNIGEIELAEGEQLQNVQLVYELPGNLTISGRVTDDAGSPSEGISVYAARGDVYRSAKTDAQGFYTLGDLGPGAYQVNAEGISWQDPAFSCTEADAGARNVDFVILRMCAVQGTVIDAETEAPIPDFEVMYPGPVMRWSRFRDAEGRFELSSLSARSVEVKMAARAEGYAAGVSEPLALSPGQTLDHVVIRLEKASMIFGRVLNPQGEPVRDATVGIDDGFIDGNTRTNAEGAFVIQGARTGTWPLRAWHSDYAPGEMPVTISAGKELHVEIHLRRGAQLRGTVTRNGEFLKNLRIELSQQISEHETGYNQECKTDNEGNYAFHGIPTGELTLRLNPMFGAQGRVIEAPVMFKGSEEKVSNIEVYQGTATAVFNVEGNDYLASNGGSIQVELEYRFGTGETEKFYTFCEYGNEIRLDGVRPGVALLCAEYYAPNLSRVLATLEPYEITIKDGIMNDFNIFFTQTAY